MSETRLNNYLRSYRRRQHLTQDEVAFLLGGECGTKISRYERERRLPPLGTALAYEAILGVPIRELFAGRFEKVEREVRRRALLLSKEREGKRRPNNALKRLAA